MPIDCVHIIDPDGNPYTFVGGLVAFGAKRHFGVSFSPAALTALAEENLAFSGTNPSESGGLAPVPALLPTELFKPREALDDVGNIQDWVKPVRLHGVMIAEALLETNVGEDAPRADLLRTS